MKFWCWVVGCQGETDFCERHKGKVVYFFDLPDRTEGWIQFYARNWSCRLWGCVPCVTAFHCRRCFALGNSDDWRESGLIEKLGKLLMVAASRSVVLLRRLKRRNFGANSA